MSYTADVCGVWADTERYQASSAAQIQEAEQLLGREHFVEAERVALSAIEDKEADVKADALRSLVKSLIGQGRQQEAWATAQEGGFQGRAKAKVMLAAAEASLGDNDNVRTDALKGAEGARQAFQSDGDKYMEARTLLAIAALRMERGELDLAGLEEGLQNAKEARQIALELRNRRLEAMCLVAMIDCEGWLVSAEDAMNMAEEALDLCLEVQDRAMEAYVLCKMSEWNVRLGDFSRAIAEVEDAVEVYRSMDSPQELKAVHLLVKLLLHLAEVREARQHVMELLERSRQKGNKVAQIEITKMLVEVHLRAGELQEAVQVSKDCIRMCKELGKSSTQASLMLKMSRGRLDVGDVPKAKTVAQDAWELLREMGPSDEKVQSLELLYEAHLRDGGIEEALSSVEDFLEHFQQTDDVLGVAKASQLSAELQLKLEHFDGAQEHALKAMESFRKARRRKEEAETLKLCSQVLWKKSEYKAAARHAEQAREKFRDLDAKEEEVSCLYIVAENAVRHAVKQGAKVSVSATADPAPREARTALEKSLKAAEAGLKLLRFTSLTKNPELHGELLCAKAQALTFQSRFEAALACLDGAVLRLRELDDYQLEANALMLAADNLEFLKRPQEAVEALEESLALYQHCSDVEGEERAQMMLQRLRKPVARPMAPTEAPSMGETSTATPVWMQGQDADPSPAEERPQEKATKEISAGPALNVSTVTSEMIVAKVREVAAAVTGDEALEVETPLMEAGMTSAGAVQLREILGKALPGITLPFTLAFDYPTLGEMSDMIHESIGVQAIKN